jgi:hypothetical protein
MADETQKRNRKDTAQTMRAVVDQTIAKSEQAPMRMVRAEIVMPYVLGDQNRSPSKAK